MALSYDKSAAIVVLPAVGGGRLQDRRLRRWLSLSRPTRTPEPGELLASILRTLNMAAPDSGLAALRMWGQTGDRPTVWIAAAEPVYLEPRLDHLCLHALGGAEVLSAELRPLFDHLQSALGDDTGVGFARIGSCGYLRAIAPVATARMPAYVIDQRRPDEFMPAGDDARSYRNLISETEMALHDHEVNMRRQARGVAPINSLWLWGGGMAPEQQTRPHPPLFSNDPLLHGYWNSNTAVAAPWPGSIDACLDAAVAGFVAEIPDTANEAAQLPDYLTELRAALQSGRLSRLRLMFRDGIRVDMEKGDAMCFWRRNSTLLGESQK